MGREHTCARVRREREGGGAHVVWGERGGVERGRREVICAWRDREFWERDGRGKGAEGPEVHVGRGVGWWAGGGETYGH